MHRNFSSSRRTLPFLSLHATRSCLPVLKLNFKAWVTGLCWLVVFGTVMPGCLWLSLGSLVPSRSSQPTCLWSTGTVTHHVASPFPAGSVQGTSHGDSHLPDAFLQGQGLKPAISPFYVRAALGAEAWRDPGSGHSISHLGCCLCRLLVRGCFLLRICVADALCGSTVIWSGLRNTWGMQITHPVLGLLLCSLDASLWMELLWAINSEKVFALSSYTNRFHPALFRDGGAHKHSELVLERVFVL